MANPKTGPLFPFRGEERFKTTLTHFFRHPRAGVADFQAHRIAVEFGTQCNRPALRHRIDGVEH
jgi:hypothetical protein